MKGNEKLYIQVGDDISGEENNPPGSRAIVQIRDAYPKILLAEPVTRSDYQRISGYWYSRWLPG